MIKINCYFNTIENFRYGYNCLQCSSCNSGYLVDTSVSQQNNGEFNYFKFVNHEDVDFKTYTFKNYTDITCDILIVGGGGPGGGIKKWDENPGGGAGGIVYIVNLVLPANTYIIKVGRGGKVKWNGSQYISEQGKNSSITDLNGDIINLTVTNNGVNKIIELVGKGGGYGGNRVSSNREPAPPAGDGGSGGGGLYYGLGGTSTQGDTFWNGVKFVKGGHDGSSSYGSRAGGGGWGRRVSKLL